MTPGLAVIHESRPGVFVVVCGCGYQSSTEWDSIPHALAQAERFEENCRGRDPAQHLAD